MVHVLKSYLDTNIIQNRLLNEEGVAGISIDEQMRMNIKYAYHTAARGHNGHCAHFEKFILYVFS